MRHFGSLLLALFTAPLVLVLTGRGIGSFRDAAASQPPDPLAGAAALASLMLAGILIALLIMPRMSPLGLMLSGLGYLAFGAWAMVDPGLFVVATPWNFLGWDGSTVVATGAVALLLAMPMLLSIFSIQRWRHPRNRWPASYAPAAYPPGSYGAGAHPAAGYPAPGYSDRSYPAPSYPAPGYGPAGYPSGGYGASAYGSAGGYQTPPYGAPAHGPAEQVAPAYGAVGDPAPSSAPLAGPSLAPPASYVSRPDPTLEIPAVSGGDPPAGATVIGPLAVPGPSPAGSVAPEEPTVVTGPGDDPTVVVTPAKQPDPDTADQEATHADPPGISANRS